MISSTVIVISSIFIGQAFETPFKKIAQNIEALMLSNNKKQLDSNFSIDEFIYLQKFIEDAYKIKEERDRAH